MNVLYEDNHIIVINKAAGEIVQGDKTGDKSLCDTMKTFLKEKYAKPGNVFVGLPHRLDRPVSGVVVEINADLEDQPELINQDAFGTWIMKVKLSDPSEVDNLLSAADYENCCK